MGPFHFILYRTIDPLVSNGLKDAVSSVVLAREVGVKSSRACGNRQQEGRLVCVEQGVGREQGWKRA